MIVRFYGDDRSHNVVKELMEAGVTTSLQTDKGREHERDFRVRIGTRTVALESVQIELQQVAISRAPELLELHFGSCFDWQTLFFRQLFKPSSDVLA